MFMTEVPNVGLSLSLHYLIVLTSRKSYVSGLSEILIRHCLIWRHLILSHKTLYI